MCVCAYTHVCTHSHKLLNRHINITLPFIVCSYYNTIKKKLRKLPVLVMYPSQEISIRSNFQVDICLRYLSRSKYRMCLLQFMSRHPGHETPRENLLLKLSPPVEAKLSADTTHRQAEAPTTPEIEFSNKDDKISKNLILKGTQCRRHKTLSI